MNDNLQENMSHPRMLAKQARRELRMTGKTSVRCPKCGGAPEMSMTAGGERTIFSCSCGYVHDVDINF